MVSVECNICNKKFASAVILRCHIRAVHLKEKPFQCKHCHKRFNKKAHMTRHEMIHTCEKPFQCDLCSKRFRTTYEVQVHLRSHTGEENYSCSQCSRKFKSSSGLRTHVMEHQGMVYKPFDCLFCSACYHSTTFLFYHIHSHTKEKPYHCEICNTEFSIDGNLRRHIKTVHSDNRPYSCDLCAKTFQSSDKMQIHLRKHLGEKPYKGEICGTGFSTKEEMKSHSLVHSDEKLYKCNGCNKSFRQPGGLTSHKRKVHTNIGTWDCKLCGKRFNGRHELSRHNVFHTGEKPYKCSRCNAKFGYSSNLRMHQRTVCKF